MTDYEKIESYVDDLLNLSGVVNGEGERPVWLLLHHLYCAVAMFSLMNDSERAEKEKNRKRNPPPCAPHLRKRK